MKDNKVNCDICACWCSKDDVMLDDYDNNRMIVCKKCLERFGEGSKFEDNILVKYYE